MDFLSKGVFDATHDNAVFVSQNVITWINAITGEQKRITCNMSERDKYQRIQNVIFMEQGEDMRIVVNSLEELIYIDPRVDTVVTRKQFPIQLSKSNSYCNRIPAIKMVKSSTGTAYLVTIKAISYDNPERSTFTIFEVTFDDIIVRVFDDHCRTNPPIYYGNIMTVDVEANSAIIWFGCAVECQMVVADCRFTSKRHGERFNRILLSVDPESGCCAWRGEWNAAGIQECDHIFITPTISGENREIFDIGLRPISTSAHVFVRGRLWFIVQSGGFDNVCFRDFDFSTDTKPCVGF